MATEFDKEHKKGLLAQFQQYLRVLLRWKWTISLIFLAIAAAAVIYSFAVTPVYTASGKVWIDDNPSVLPFQEVQSFGLGTSNLQSHARLLRSKTLASDTINSLKLFENHDFAGRPKKGEKRPDPDDPRFREELVQLFLSNVSVSPLERTQLIEVKFSNRNPDLAARALNALFDAYIGMIVRQRYSASEKVTEFLNTSIAELRSDIEIREKELNQYGSEKDILPLTAAEAPTVSRIDGVNRELTAATLDKINKLNYYNQLKANPLGVVPNAPEGSLIARLREQYVTLSRQYRTGLATVTPEYPEMRKLKSELDSATEALQNETQNLIRNAYNDYEIALRREQSLRKLLDDQKNEAYKANSDSVVYNSLRIELENKKVLLESLSKWQSETDVSSKLEGLEALNVWIVDKADYPLRPAFPNKRKTVLIGILFGLAVGTGLAIGFEYLNQTTKTTKDVTASVGLPILGAVPAFEDELKPKGPKGEFRRVRSILGSKTDRLEGRTTRRRRARSTSLLNTEILTAGPEATRGRSPMIELIASREPQSIQAESYRSIRTTLLVSSPPGRIKTILLTSPLAKEGKSSTVSNMGITLAEASKKVVIIDADLRKPKQLRMFGMSSGSGPGLSRYLSSDVDAGEVAIRTEFSGLHLIPSGPLPANPIELLTSERMDNLISFLKRNFDFVLIDTPPLLAVSDALAMGPMVDAIILIAKGGRTPIQALKQAKQKLDAHKLKCLGVILNGVDLVEQDGYYARQYYSYSKAE